MQEIIEAPGDILFFLRGFSLSHIVQGTVLIQDCPFDCTQTVHFLITLFMGQVDRSSTQKLTPAKQTVLLWEGGVYLGLGDRGNKQPELLDSCPDSSLTQVWLD